MTLENQKLIGFALTLKKQPQMSKVHTLMVFFNQAKSIKTLSTNQKIYMTLSQKSKKVRKVI